MTPEIPSILHRTREKVDYRYNIASYSIPEVVLGEAKHTINDSTLINAIPTLGETTLLATINRPVHKLYSVRQIQDSAQLQLKFPEAA